MKMGELLKTALSMWLMLMATAAQSQTSSVDKSAMRCVLQERGSDRSRTPKSMTMLFEGVFPSINVIKTKTIDPDNLLERSQLIKVKSEEKNGLQTLLLTFGSEKRITDVLAITISINGKLDAIFGDVRALNLEHIGRCFLLTGPDAPKLYERDLQRAREVKK